MKPNQTNPWRLVYLACAVMALLLAACLSGCGPVKDHLAGVGTSLSRIDLRADTIEANAGNVTLVKQQAGLIHVDVKDGQGDLTRANADRARLEKQLANPWVRAALAIRSWFYWILGIWLALNVASIALGAFGGPVGLVWSKRIIKAIIFGNPAAWIRDRIIASRATP